LKDDLAILFAADLGPAISAVETFGASTRLSGQHRRRVPAFLQYIAGKGRTDSAFEPKSLPTPVSAVGKRNFPGQRQRPRNGPCNSIGTVQRQNACTNRRQFGAFRTEPGNLRLRRTAWWAREDSNWEPASTRCHISNGRKDWTSVANGASVSLPFTGRLALPGSCPAGDAATVGLRW
jgi:hypothetical protein